MALDCSSAKRWIPCGGQPVQALERAASSFACAVGCAAWVSSFFVDDTQSVPGLASDLELPLCLGAECNCLEPFLGRTDVGGARDEAKAGLLGLAESDHQLPGVERRIAGGQSCFTPLNLPKGERDEKGRHGDDEDRERA